MRKTKTLITSILLIAMAFVSIGDYPFSNVYASELTGSTLDKYVNKLNELNSELGTTYAIPDNTTYEASGQAYEELIAFYSGMTINEFEAYIRNVNNKISNYKEMDKTCEIFLQEPDTIFTPPVTRLQTQKLIFTNGNYFYIKAYVYTGEGNIRYSRMYSYGDEISVYPAYRVQDMTYTYNSDCTAVNVTFKAGKYAAPNLLMTTTPIYFTVKFLSAGGNLYETMEI